MNIADIIVESTFDTEYEKKRLATALQNWQRTSANNYPSEILSRVPSEAQKIYAGGKGGLSPADAISQAVENVKANLQKNQQGDREAPGYAKAGDSWEKIQKANKKRSKDNDSSRVGKDGKKWGNQYYQDTGSFSGRLKKFMNTPNIDLSTADKAAGSGMDFGSNLAQKADAFMNFGRKMAKTTR